MATPVLFLPGMMCDARLFDPQIAHLAGSYDILIGDLSEGASLDDIARHICASLEGPVHVVGLSMGGILALHLALHWPQYVASLTLIDTNGRADKPESAPVRHAQIKAVQNGELENLMRNDLTPLYVHDAEGNQDILELCVEMAMNLGPKVFESQSLALLNRDSVIDRLDEIAVPTLILCGAEDKLCSLEDHRSLEQGIATAHLQIIDHCGHLATLEHPDVVNAALLAFLTSH